MSRRKRPFFTSFFSFGIAVLMIVEGLQGTGWHTFFWCAAAGVPFGIADRHAEKLWGKS